MNTTSSLTNTALATISLEEDPGDYVIDWLIWIWCTIGGLFVDLEDDLNVPIFPCNAGGITSVVVLTMINWDSLAWERGATVICVNDFVTPAFPMDSFGQIFSGSYYTPTNDPCRIAFSTAMQLTAIGGFHSHPLFTSNSELNAGNRCHGAPQPYNLSGAEINDVNNDNETFQGGDFDWPDDTGTPFYLLVPYADEIKILDTNENIYPVWPI